VEANNMTVHLSRFFDLGFRSLLSQQPSPVEHERGYAYNTRVPATGARLALIVAFLAAVALAGVFKPFAVATPSQRELVVAILFIILGGAIVLILLASLMFFLRKRNNPLYWEVACWALVALGIVVRQILPTSVDNPHGTTLTPIAVIVSGVVALAIFPGIMRWLNSVPRTPGLAQVAIPFSIGFFVDLAQVLTSKYVVSLPWISGA
jgi:hypothetical protein